MSKLKSCTITPCVNVTFNFEYENGYVKTVTLKEGQFVKNLVYTVNGIEKVITGIVRVINFISKQGISTNDGCIHDDTPVFGKYVSITTLNVDCSSQYKCEVVSVPTIFIKDIESVEDVVVNTAKVNGVEYANLVDALAAVKDGDVIELADDFQSKEKVVLGADDIAVTLDLNDHRLFIPEVENNYGCIIKGDVTVTGAGKFVNGGLYGIGVPASAKLTINGGTFTCSSDYLIGTWGETVINGGEFISNYCCVNGFDNGKVIINGGKFIANAADNDPDWGWSVVLGNVAITGGTFNFPIHEKYCSEGYRPKANSDGTYTVEKVNG
jgi:hypothetical protein